MAHRPWTGVEAGLLLNERFADLPTDHARLVYVALLLACDSHGCIEDAPRALVSQLFPLLARTHEDLDAALWALADVALIDRMEGETGRWIRVRKWDDKQGGKIRRRGVSRWPSHGEPRLPGHSGTTPGPVPSTPPARAAARSLSSVSGTSGVTEISSSPQKEKGATRPARLRAPSREVEAALPPDGLPSPTWALWLTHLWQRKKPTATALDGHRKKLAALVLAQGVAAAAAFIEACINANAQGIPEWAYDKALAGAPKVAMPGGQPAKDFDIDAYYRRLNGEDTAADQKRHKAAGNTS